MIVWLAIALLWLLALLFVLALCYAAASADELDDEIERYLRGRS